MIAQHVSVPCLIFLALCAFQFQGMMYFHEEKTISY